MLSYKAHLSRASYNQVDEHAHQGKGVVKKVIEVIEKMAENAHKDHPLWKSLHKILPSLNNQTSRHAMEEFKAYTLAQSNRCQSLQRSLAEGPLAEAQVLLNNYRMEWPLLQELATEATKILNELEKTEKELRKKRTKTHEVDAHLKNEIEEGQELMRVSSMTLAAAAGQVSSLHTVVSAFGEGLGATSKTSPTKPVTRHTRSKTASLLNFFKKKRSSAEVDSIDQASARARSPSLSKKSLRKMEKQVHKMVTKASKVAANAKAAERAHKTAKEELDNGITLHTIQMKEILAGFQRLEMGRSTAVRDILLQCFQQHRQVKCSRLAMQSTQWNMPVH